MAPWYTTDSVYNSPETFAEDADDYLTSGGCHSWSSTHAALTASPITPMSSFSTCISPTAVAFKHPEPYVQWSVGEWQPPFEREDFGLSSGSDPVPPPPKRQKHRNPGGGSCSKRVAKPAASMPLLPTPATPPTISADTPPSPPTTPPERVGQLRTASRKAKRTSAHKPAASEEERRARASHNLVEKQYRNRLNAQFERLLAVLPPPGSDDDGGGGDDRRLSKAEVLEIARRRIKALEKERDTLRLQKKELAITVGRMRDALVRQRRESE